MISNNARELYQHRNDDKNKRENNNQQPTNNNQQPTTNNNANNTNTPNNRRAWRCIASWRPRKSVSVDASYTAAESVDSQPSV